VRAALAEGLESFGRGLWRGGLPASVRLGLIAGIMKSAGKGPAVRRLASGVAAGGAAALAADPAQALASIEALAARGASPVLIAGDSHSRLYVQRDRRGGRWLLPLHHLATGASARGLARAGSRSGEGERLRGLLEAAEAAGASFPVLLVFGQVDVEFIFTFKRLEQDPPANHDGRAFDAFCRETAEAYAAFAAGLPMAPDLALAEIFPPALSDAAWRQGYLNAHIAQQHTTLEPAALGERLAATRVEDLAARTGQHRVFNGHLRAAAEARGVAVIEAFDDLLNPCGVAGPERLGPAAGRDHHLDVEAVRPATVTRLWTMIDAAARTPAARA
jgi:hypothetical protein